MPPKENETKIDCSPKRIAWLANQLSGDLNSSIREIQEINDQTKIISINAKITSARAGEAGKSFAVVANEIMNLSYRTATVAKALNQESQGSIEELTSISGMLDSQVRGQRLSIYTRTNIDLIDRNLYERSCDVRWWATDSSLTDALSEPTPPHLDYASKRLGVILSAYTVYYDLILADKDGNIVANGRPELYQSKGRNVSSESWFQQAMSSRDGDEYGLQSVHESSLVDGNRVLIYSCAVREKGEKFGEPLGALGIVFNWDSLAQVVVKNTPLSEEEWAYTRVCILDDSGSILADSHDQMLREVLRFQKSSEVFSSTFGFLETRVNDRKSFVAHAPSEGFETYKSGWTSVLIQSI